MRASLDSMKAKTSSKGFLEEMTWLIIIIVAVLILALFIFNQQFRGVEVEQKVEERILNEEGISLLFSLSQDKPPYVERFYAQILIDAVLQGISNKKETNKVYYGAGIGKVNATEIIPQLVSKFTTKNWQLTVVTPDGSYIYGQSNPGNILYSYEVLVPVPEERTGKLIFEIS